MGFGRLYADTQRGGHLLAAFSLREQLHDLALARGKAVANRFWKLRAGTASIEIAENDLGCARSEKRLVVGEGFNGDDEVPIRVRFHDIASHAGLKNVSNQLVGIMHGKNQNFRVRRCLPNSS